MALLLASPWLMAPARAAGIGLTGPFGLDKWTLVFSAGDPLGPGPASKPNPSYQCATPTSTACVDDIQPVSGDFIVVGATNLDYPSPPGNYNGEPFETNWVLAPDPSRQAPYRVSFDFLFNTSDQNKGILGYFSINGVPTDVQSSTNGTSSSGSYVIQPGDSIAFGLRSNKFDGNVGFVTITGFDATEVPAPLPLLGAGAAFGWSRRLRRRIRSRVAMASR